MTGGHFCWSLCLDLANILLLPAKNTLIVKNSSFGQYTAFCKPSKRPTSAFKYVILEKSLKFHSLKKKLRLRDSHQHFVFRLSLGEAEFC